jgi:hypothetical protein
MGAGNVKPRPPEPTPLRLTSPTANGSSSLSTPLKSNNPNHHLRIEDHISPVPASPSPKRWDVTCDIHRSIICRFCGGKSCKREDWRKQKETPAIAGLHSTWVSANVLGMQRPSSRLIKEYGIIDSLKRAGVGAIFNLQLAGEHPHCADGIHPSGFSYYPEEMTDHGIFYYNPGWVDMDIPSLERMLEVTQMMSFHTEKSQKVAVHWSDINISRSLCNMCMDRSGRTIALILALYTCFFSMYLFCLVMLVTVVPV